MKPHVIFNTRFVASNLGGSINIEEDEGHSQELWVHKASMNSDAVISLRNWLNEWLDKHVFVVPPRA